MLIVSFYTPDYAEHAYRLRQSVNRFGYNFWIEEVEDCGVWEHNCARKASFIQRALEATCDDVLWLDADAEILRPWNHPVEFDFAVYKAGRGNNRFRFRSGTVWFNYTMPARTLAQRWVNRCARNPHVWDQESLYISWKNATEAEKHCVDGPLRTHWLDKSFCQIFDDKHGVDNPHIVHYQASRKLKAKTHA